MIIKSSFLQNFGGNLQQIIALLEENFLKEIEEIRIRINKPLLLSCKKKEYFIKRDGKIAQKIEEAYLPSSEDIRYTQIGRAHV